jgi:hypothetical protein
VESLPSVVRPWIPFLASQRRKKKKRKRKEEEKKA